MKTCTFANSITEAGLKLQEQQPFFLSFFKCNILLLKKIYTRQYACFLIHLLQYSPVQLTHSLTHSTIGYIDKQSDIYGDYMNEM